MLSIYLDGEEIRIAKPFIMVWAQIKEKGEDPYMWILPASVHGIWKIKKNQSVIIVVKEVNRNAGSLPIL